MPDETKETQKDSLPQGKAPVGSEGTTPKVEPQTYTQDQLSAAVQNALIKAGRDAKSFELKGQSLTERETKLKAWEEQQEHAQLEAIKNNPEALDLHKQKKTLKEERAALEKEKLEHAEEIRIARETKREIEIWEVAQAKGVDPVKLKTLSTKFNIEGKERLEELAGEVISGKPQEPKEPSQHIDSGMTTGAKKSLSSLTADEKLQKGFADLKKK